ncbi:unnamed protein product [Angiostrongylus costaricensis]|uniref:Uncharacterized protein n=1 Tax=Angiostrongylus costaricensis TaxID=334426 RepID=A0A0R3PXP0_ANGCS|nr:unnamed protein product [Angiostrongylus costaricensis]
MAAVGQSLSRINPSVGGKLHNNGAPRVRLDATMNTHTSPGRPSLDCRLESIAEEDEDVEMLAEKAFLFQYRLSYNPGTGQ